jgi:hypothetical protein
MLWLQAVEFVRIDRASSYGVAERREHSGEARIPWARLRETSDCPILLNPNRMLAHPWP